jgi:hypothetical protein
MGALLTEASGLIDLGGARSAFAFALGNGNSLGEWYQGSRVGGFYSSNGVGVNSFGMADAFGNRNFIQFQMELTWPGPVTNDSHNFYGGKISMNDVGATGDANLQLCGGNAYNYPATGMATLFGGDCETATGWFSVAAGEFSITGLPWKPDMVVFMGCNSYNYWFFNSALFSLGAADKDGNQWAAGIHGERDTSASSHRNSEFSTGLCIVQPGTGGYSSGWGSYEGRDACAFVSMNSDGFTLNGVEASSGGTVMYMAFKASHAGDGFCVGTGMEGDTSFSTGFDPDGLVVCGVGTRSDDISAATWAQIGVGFTDGVTERSSFGGAGSGADSFGSRYYGDSVISFGNPTAMAMGAEASATLGSGGFSFDWTTTDGGGRQFGYWAFKTASVPMSAPTVVSGNVTNIDPNGYPPGLPSWAYGKATVHGTITPNTDETGPDGIQYLWQFAFVGDFVDYTNPSNDYWRAQTDALTLGTYLTGSDPIDLSLNIYYAAASPPDFNWSYIYYERTNSLKFRLVAARSLGQSVDYLNYGWCKWYGAWVPWSGVQVGLRGYFRGEG